MAIFGDMEQVQSNDWMADWILSKLRFIPIDPDELERIETELCSDVPEERLNELYLMVCKNIPEPIEYGLNYNQTDIHRKLDMIIKDERK